MGTSPGLVFNQIPTTEQWNGYFIRKLDDLAPVFAEPGTGATLESGVEQGGWILKPPGEIATLNIIAPPGTFDRQRFVVSTTETIDDLIVVAAGGGDSMEGGAVGVLAAQGVVAWIYRLADNTWYRWMG